MKHTLDLVIKDLWLAAGIVWLVTAFSGKRTIKRQPWRARALQLLCVLIAALLVADPYFAPNFLDYQLWPVSIQATWIALALTSIGIVFAIWARFYLGKNWSATPTIKQDHELIRSGPYSLVRHPIYTGFLLALLGAVINLGQVRGFVALLVVISALKWKSLAEESLMQQQFGSQYGDYRRQVRGLIPFVW